MVEPLEEPTSRIGPGLELGRGRSGVVVRCALARRRILVDLVELWFGSKLRVAPAHSIAWNASTASFQMDTQLVEGSPAALHHPFSGGREGEAPDLGARVMRPLQNRLAEAGFDGLVWQAGRGNPVAFNNFLCLRTPGSRLEWAWIDLESGVPALIPIDPLALLSFYLPKSWQHGRALFDDVDIAKLRRYANEQRERLQGALGGERFSALLEQIERLEAHQDGWRSQRRVMRGIGYRLARGQLSQEQADWYGEHPLAWYARELQRGFAAALSLVARLAERAYRMMLRADYLGALRAVWCFASSQRYRAQLAHRYVANRIDRWEQRGQLTGEETHLLRDALRREAVGSYISDFGVHVAIKPPIKLMQWGLVPLLFAAGLIGPATTAALIAFGGMIGRTLYTLGRMVASAAGSERLPWIALTVGLLPVVGNVAYPVQILYLGTQREGKLAGFIVYDSMTVTGELLPIWGGRDTATEHWFNHLADWIVRDRPPLLGTSAPLERDSA